MWDQIKWVGGYSNIGIGFLAKNHFAESAVWEGLFSWCKIYLSGVFIIIINVLLYAFLNLKA